MSNRGTTIDGFVIGAHVHAGGMANLYDVTRPGSAARLVMKIPRVGPNEPTEAIIGFQTEAAILPLLSGPHVPHFVAAGDLATQPYLVTEWIDGVSLDDVLAKGPLPQTDVVRIGAAIADALHSIHDQETVHLDVKPANVILRTDGGAALVDFGFARHARLPDLLGEETRFSAGSAAYVSPEQIAGTREDPRSDIFSLGVVLYEAVTDALPFDTTMDVRNRLWLEPIPPRVMATQLDPWLQEIILRCLEPRAGLRYQSAAHVAFDLRNPEQVALTARAKKSRRAGFGQLVRRFLRARRERADVPPPRARPPIVMVAVDTVHLDDERQPAIRRATAQVLSLSIDFRLICVSVIPTGAAIDSERETASGQHLEHLVRLRNWVEPLHMPATRMSLHAIESPRAAEALLEFARRNHVDLIILGAPGTWGDSVASTVTAKARCSVHVIRV